MSKIDLKGIPSLNAILREKKRREENKLFQLFPIKGRLPYTDYPKHISFLMQEPNTVKDFS